MPFLSNCTGYRNYKFPRGYQKSNIRRLEKHFLVWRVSISDLDDKVVLSINSWGWWWLCNDMGVIFQVRIIYIQPTWVLFLTMSGLLWPHCASSWWLLSKSLVARKIGNRCRDLLECVKEIQCIWQKQYSSNEVNVCIWMFVSWSRRVFTELTVYLRLLPCWNMKLLMIRCFPYGLHHGSKSSCTFLHL